MCFDVGTVVDDTGIIIEHFDWILKYMDIMVLILKFSQIAFQMEDVILHSLVVWLIDTRYA